MRQTPKTLLAIILIALAGISLMPSASAAITYTSTFGSLSDREKDFVQSPQNQLLTATGACNSAATVNLTILSPNAYVLTGTATSTATTISVWRESANLLYSYSASTPGTVTDGDITDEWTPLLVWTETATGTIVNNMVILIGEDTNLGNMYWTCSGSVAARATFTTTASGQPQRGYGIPDANGFGVWRPSGSVQTGAAFPVTYQKPPEQYIRDNEHSFLSTGLTQCTIIPGSGFNQRTFPFDIDATMGQESWYVYTLQFINGTYFPGSPADYEVTTSIGGAAVDTGIVYSDYSVSPALELRAWRLFYFPANNTYWNSSQTGNEITFDLSGMSSASSLKVCKFVGASNVPTPNQPFTPHITNWTASNTTGIAGETYWSQDDYYTEAILQFVSCQDFDCAVEGDPVPNVTVTTISGSGVRRTNLTDSNGKAYVIGYDLSTAAFTVYGNKTGYVVIPYSVSVSQGISNVTLRMIPSSALPPLVEASCINAFPVLRNFTVPAAANFTITQCVKSEIYASVYLKQVGTNLPSLITPVSKLVSFNLTYTYAFPDYGYSNNVSGDNQVGSYVLAISNASGGLELAVPFVISDTVTFPPLIDVTSSVTLGLIQQQITPATIAAKNNAQTAETQNVLEQGTSFAYSTWLLIPNMYLWLIIMIFVALLMAGVSRRYGGD